jgi:AraC-like DNA-binding protein
VVLAARAPKHRDGGDEARFVSSGLVKLVWQMAEQEGVSRAELLAVAGLDAADLKDPAAPIPAQALAGVLRALHQRTQDPALGIRIADAFDLRQLGFWGYALRSCLTLRQRMQLLAHYQKLFNHAGRIWLRLEAEKAIIEFPLQVPPDLVHIAGDFTAAACIREHTARTGCSRPAGSLWLSYPEQPHHQQLRARISGSIVFNAPECRFEIPAHALDRRDAGDPYLLELAKQQLDAIVAGLGRASSSDVLGQVRHRLATALASDPSLQRLAMDLRLSARTLRRQLRAAGASFQELVEETRHATALTYLTNTDHDVKEVAARLGYSDPSNFRRAFRRWTGLSPAAYRAKHGPS